MTYVLGTASVTSAPLRLQNTVQNDGFISLAAAYGVTPAQIIAFQPELAGKPLNNKTVQAFVKSRPGWNAAEGLFAFKSDNNPGTVDAQGKPEGFAHFTNATQLMLPEMPRLDGKGPTSPGAPPGALKPVFPDIKKAGVSPLLVLLGLGGLAFLVLGGKKKKKPAPKAVAF